MNSDCLLIYLNDRFVSPDEKFNVPNTIIKELFKLTFERLGNKIARKAA